MDKDVRDVLQDDLLNRIHEREDVEVNSDEFSLLTQLIANNSEQLIKAEKALSDAEIAREKIKQEKETRESELEFRRKQHEEEISIRKAEIDLKMKQHEEEMKMRVAEMEQRHAEFMEEMRVKESLDKKKNIQMLCAAGITVVGSVICVVLKINHENHWIPEMMNFEQEGSFTYTAAKEMTKKVFKQ